MLVAVAFLLLLARKTTLLDGLWHLLDSLFFLRRFLPTATSSFSLAGHLSMRCCSNFCSQLFLQCQTEMDPSLCLQLCLLACLCYSRLQLRSNSSRHDCCSDVYFRLRHAPFGDVASLIWRNYSFGSTIWPQPLGYRWITWGFIFLTFKNMLKVWRNLFAEFQVFIATVCTAFVGVLICVALERPLMVVMKRR